MVEGAVSRALHFFKALVVYTHHFTHHFLQIFNRQPRQRATAFGLPASGIADMLKPQAPTITLRMSMTITDGTVRQG